MNNNDIAKPKSAIAAAAKEISLVYKATVAAGEGDPSQLNGLQSLGKANLALTKATERLEQAVEKTTPKPKEEKPKAAKK